MGIIKIMKENKEGKEVKEFDKTPNELRKILKADAAKLSTTYTIHKESIAHTNIKDIFDTLNEGATMTKDELKKKLPYNMVLPSAKIKQARKDIPDPVTLKDFIKFCLCIKSPQDYVNLYLFELLGYPKEHNMFMLGTKYIYTVENSESIDVVMPTNILKGALKLYYDIFAIKHNNFLEKNMSHIQYEIESYNTNNKMRFDLVFRITSDNKRLEYIKEYHERYHYEIYERMRADELEQSLLKLKGTALTVFDFGDKFYQSYEANTFDIQRMCSMITNALMHTSILRYKLIILLFEKDLQNTVSDLELQLNNYNSTMYDGLNEIYNERELNEIYVNLNDTYKEKKTILEEFRKNKSVKKLFDMKEICYNTKDEYIISIDQLYDLFNIEKTSDKATKGFRMYILGLGFRKNTFAWHQISRIISKYDNEEMRIILDEYYIYLEKNYTMVINMKDEYTQNSSPDGNKDFDNYIPHLLKEYKLKIEVLSKNNEHLKDCNKMLQENIQSFTGDKHHQLVGVYQDMYTTYNHKDISKYEDGIEEINTDEYEEVSLPSLILQSDSEDDNSKEDDEC